MPWHQSVPIVIDSVKNITGYQMTRCTYFVIQAEQPQIGWQLGIAGKRIPILLLGLSGVVLGSPDSENELFDSPTAIQSFIDSVETEDSPLLVDTEDIWLPTICFKNRSEVQRGEVFRVGIQLFHEAYNFRQSLSNIQEFVINTNELSHEIEFSAVETIAFKDWNAELVDIAKGNYMENKEMFPEKFMQRKQDKDSEPMMEF